MAGYSNHALAIGSARVLAKLGHISESKRDKIASGSKNEIAAMKKASPKTPKPTGVNRDSSVKVKTSHDQPNKATTPTAKSRNQPYY